MLIDNEIVHIHNQRPKGKPTFFSHCPEPRILLLTAKLLTSDTNQFPNWRKLLVLLILIIQNICCIYLIQGDSIIYCGK